MPEVFISNGKKGKRARKPRDTERACVRGRVLQQEKDNVNNKTDC